MHLVEKQHAAVGGFECALFIGLRPGKGAFHIAKQVRRQQLRVAGVLGAVKAHKGGIVRQQSLGNSEGVHQVRHVAFAGAAVAGDQQRQAASGIEECRFQLGNGLFEAAVMPDQQCKMIRRRLPAVAII